MSMAIDRDAAILRLVGDDETAATRTWPVPAGSGEDELGRRLVLIGRAGLDTAAIALGFLAAALAVGVTGTLAATTVVVALAAWLLSFAASGLYERSRVADASTEIRSVARAGAIGTAIVAIGAPAFDLDLAGRWLPLSLVTGTAFVVAGRLAARRALRSLQGRGIIGLPTLVVGCNEEARGIARSLGRGASVGYRAVGFIATEDEHPTEVEGLPVLGRLAGMEGMIQSTGAGAVVVASTAMPSAALPRLCNALQQLSVEVKVTAGLPHVSSSRVVVTPLDGVPVVAVRRHRLSRLQAAAKRSLDVTVAVTGLLVAAPLLAVVALLVRMSDGPGVLFRQVRVGRDGRPFTIYKFRTMVHDAESMLIDLRERNEADGLLFKISDDPRVTSLGRVLRRWALDELPQLWNVLRGEMSLVGPRPPLLSEAARYDDAVRGRLLAKPGLTGLWQVNGQHALTFDDYVRYDLFYVENWSFAMDLAVIVRTIPALLGRRSG